MIAADKLEKLQDEARAKIFWGDEPETVTDFLTQNGIAVEEAKAIVSGICLERTASVRSSGIRKIVIGSLLALVPIVAYCIFLAIGVLPIKIFSLTVAVGVWGAWKILKGSLMVFSPEMEKGDLADDSD